MPIRTFVATSLRSAAPSTGSAGLTFFSGRVVRPGATPLTIVRPRDRHTLRVWAEEGADGLGCCRPAYGDGTVWSILGRASQRPAIRRSGSSVTARLAVWAFPGSQCCAGQAACGTAGGRQKRQMMPWAPESEPPIPGKPNDRAGPSDLWGARTGTLHPP